MKKELRPLPPYFVYASENDEYNVDLWFSTKRLKESYLQGKEDNLHLHFDEKNGEFGVNTHEDYLFLNRRDFWDWNGELNLCPFDLIREKNESGEEVYKLGEGRDYYKIVAHPNGWTDSFYCVFPYNVVGIDKEKNLDEMEDVDYALYLYCFWDGYNSEAECNAYWQKVLDEVIASGFFE